MKQFSPEEIQENHERYILRLEFYKTRGYDTIVEREFVLDCAEPLDGAVVEIGTGKGYLTIPAALRGHRLTTFEIDETQQRFAILNAAHYGVDDLIDFRTGSVYSLDLPDGSAGAVLFVNTYHHLERAGDALAEMDRVLEKGGKIVVADFTQEGFDLMDRIHGEEGHGHDRGPYPPGDPARRLRGLGFSVETFRNRYQEVAVAIK